MRTLSIQEIIKVLPLDKEVRENLLTNYESYDTAKKFEVYHICTKGFHKLQEELENIKYQLFLQEIDEGKRQLSETIMNEVQTAVAQDIEEMIMGNQEAQQLESVRNQLQTLINKHSN